MAGWKNESMQPREPAGGVAMSAMDHARSALTHLSTRAVWEESKHPREDDGKFGDGGGGTAVSDGSPESPSSIASSDGGSEPAAPASADSIPSTCKAFDKPPVRKAVLDYMTVTYHAVNGKLRRGTLTEEELDDSDMTPDEVDADVARIDEALATTKPLEAPVTVFRGVNLKKMGFSDPKGLVGSTITDNGFVSTTTNRSKGVHFGSYSAENAALFEITVPAGAQALYVSKLMSNDTEQEALLPRGGSFVVESMASKLQPSVYSDDPPMPVFRARYVPPPPRQPAPPKKSRLEKLADRISGRSETYRQSRFADWSSDNVTITHEGSETRAVWEESKHPREDDGKFGSGMGGGGGGSDSDSGKSGTSASSGSASSGSSSDSKASDCSGDVCVETCNPPCGKMTAAQVERRMAGTGSVGKRASEIKGYPAEVNGVSIAEERVLTPFDTPEVLAARIAIRDQKPTINIEGRESIRATAADKAYGSGARVKNRQADIIIGGPGVGKSTAVADALVDEGSMVIDTDHVKQYLPEFADGRGAGIVHEESAEIAEKNVLGRAIQSGDNIVLPKVGRSTGSVMTIADKLVEAGYTVRLHYVDVPVDKQTMRGVKRFLEQGRFVDPDYIYNDVGTKPKATYEKIKDSPVFKNVTLHDNDVAMGEKPRVFQHRSNDSAPRSPEIPDDVVSRLDSDPAYLARLRELAKYRVQEDGAVWEPDTDAMTVLTLSTIVDMLGGSSKSDDDAPPPKGDDPSRAEPPKTDEPKAPEPETPTPAPPAAPAPEPKDEKKKSDPAKEALGFLRQLSSRRARAASPKGSSPAMPATLPQRSAPPVSNRRADVQHHYEIGNDIQVRAEPREGKFPDGVCGQITGTILVYGVPDAYGTLFVRGCLDRTRREKIGAGKVKLFADHGPFTDTHVGVVRSITDEGDNAIMVADIFDTEAGRRLKEYLNAVIAARSETGLSVGFIPRRKEWKAASSRNGGLPGDQVCYFEEIELRECSITPVPAVPGTTVTSVRAEFDESEHPRADDGKFGDGVGGVSMDADKAKEAVPEFGSGGASTKIKGDDFDGGKYGRVATLDEDGTGDFVAGRPLTLNLGGTNHALRVGDKLTLAPAEGGRIRLSINGDAVHDFADESDASSSLVFFSHALNHPDGSPTLVKKKRATRKRSDIRAFGGQPFGPKKPGADDDGQTSGDPKRAGLPKDTSGVKCSKCGEPVVGKFCAACGTPAPMGASADPAKANGAPESQNSPGAYPGAGEPPGSQEGAEIDANGIAKQQVPTTGDATSKAAAGPGDPAAAAPAPGTAVAPGTVPQGVTPPGQPPAVAAQAVPRVEITVKVDDGSGTNPIGDGDGLDGLADPAADVALLFRALDGILRAIPQSAARAIFDDVYGAGRTDRQDGGPEGNASQPDSKPGERPAEDPAADAESAKDSGSTGAASESKEDGEGKPPFAKGKPDAKADAAPGADDKDERPLSQRRNDPSRVATSDDRARAVRASLAFAESIHG